MKKPRKSRARSGKQKFYRSTGGVSWTELGAGALGSHPITYFKAGVLKGNACEP